jgi:hypothetical protein
LTPTGHVGGGVAGQACQQQSLTRFLLFGKAARFARKPRLRNKRARALPLAPTRKRASARPNAHRQGAFALRIVRQADMAQYEAETSRHLRMSVKTAAAPKGDRIGTVARK